MAVPYGVRERTRRPGSTPRGPSPSAASSRTASPSGSASSRRSISSSAGGSSTPSASSSPSPTAPSRSRCRPARRRSRPRCPHRRRLRRARRPHRHRPRRQRRLGPRRHHRGRHPGRELRPDRGRERRPRRLLPGRRHLPRRARGPLRRHHQRQGSRPHRRPAAQHLGRGAVRPVADRARGSRRVNGPWRGAVGATYKHWSAYPGASEATVRCPPSTRHAGMPFTGTCTAPRPPRRPTTHDTVTPAPASSALFEPSGGVTIDGPRRRLLLEPSPAPEQTGASNRPTTTPASPSRSATASRLGPPFPPIALDLFRPAQLLLPRDHVKDADMRARQPRRRRRVTTSGDDRRGRASPRSTGKF